MRRTRLGILLLVTGAACFAVAFVARSIAPAIFGTILVAATLAQRPPSELVEVTRTVPEEVTEGAPFEVRIVATCGHEAPIFIETSVPASISLLATRSEPGRGKAQMVFQAVARQTGSSVWGNVHVRVQDVWGVTEQEFTMPLRNNMRVVPGTDALAAGRAVGRIEEVGSRSKRGISADWESEIERLRDYQPGDRLRDIDWAHSTVLGKLIARERARYSSLPIVVLMQTTTSVRWIRRVSKFETFRLTALGVMAAAQGAGLPAGLVAYDDRGVGAQVRVSSSRRAIAATMRRLSEMPSVEPVDTVEASLTASALTDVPTRAERAFLQAIARFDPRAPRGLTPVEAALAAVASVSPQPALVVCLLDAEETPALVKTVVQRLARHGHRCIVAAPLSGPHHYAFTEVDDAVMRSLLLWRRNREEAARACAELRVPLVFLGPRVDARMIREVIRSTRSG